MLSTESPSSIVPPGRDTLGPCRPVRQSKALHRTTPRRKTERRVRYICGPWPIRTCWSSSIRPDPKPARIKTLPIKPARRSSVTRRMTSRSPVLVGLHRPRPHSPPRSREDSSATPEEHGGGRQAGTRSSPTILIYAKVPAFRKLRQLAMSSWSGSRLPNDGRASEVVDDGIAS